MLTYDYSLAPADADPTLDSVPLWSTAWCLGVPEGVQVHGDSLAVFGPFRPTGRPGRASPCSR